MTVRDVTMAPNNFRENDQAAETLRGLMDRLCAPDLTAAESQTLRPRLFQLLEAIDADKRRLGSGPSGGDRRITREPKRFLTV